MGNYGQRNNIAVQWKPAPNDASNTMAPGRILPRLALDHLHRVAAHGHAGALASVQVNAGAAVTLVTAIQTCNVPRRDAR